MNITRIIALSTFMFSILPVAEALAAGDNRECISKITILENTLDAERIKFRDNKCELLRAAAANRSAMLNEINASPDMCGMKAETVASLKTQYEKFTTMQASVCQ